MKRFAIALLLLLLALPAVSGATAQTPDRLLLDGEDVALYTNPLSAYLAEHPKALPETTVLSSGNWRGYVACFTAKDGQLVLDRIMMEGVDAPSGAKSPEDEEVDVLDRVFPGQQEVPATWYSGTLVIPRGKLVSYVHMGYGSSYERYTLLMVRAGQIVERKDLSLEEFEAYRKTKFEAFKKTPDFARHLEEAMTGEYPMSREEAEDFIKAFESERYLSVP